MTDADGAAHGLHDAMIDGAVSLVPLAEAHREGLRAACAADPEIWTIYPYSLFGAAFDPGFERILNAGDRLPFAILEHGDVIGCTTFWHYPSDAVVEIGGTYLRPSARGSGLNTRVKALMLRRAFGFGIRRVEFRVDTRNRRSMAAVEKLGATREGVLRQNRVTWTGFVRDTAVYSLLAGERT